LPNIVTLGVFAFTSGFAPTGLNPTRDIHTVEHGVPGADGGVTENIGSKQPVYQIRGFLAPHGDAMNDHAGGLLSGQGYSSQSADQSKQLLDNLGSGDIAQLFKVESNSSPVSGVPVYFEENFFLIKNFSVSMVGGVEYPYYPYSFSLMQHKPKTVGNSSGLTRMVFSGQYFSGYIHSWEIKGTSGVNTNRRVAGLGLYATSAASGNVKLAIYDNVADANFLAQSLPMAIHSGWNYAPVNPTVSIVSGQDYQLAFKGDIISTSGYTVGGREEGGSADRGSFQSGEAYASAWPTKLHSGSNTFELVSGRLFSMVIVT